MKGAILGDIVGSIYEFDNIKTTEFEFFGEGATFTDDTILTIAVADWLLEGALTKERLAFTLAYYVKRYPSPMGNYGTRFLQWAYGNINQPYNSWGNGSAMRVSAVGWCFDTLEKTEEVAELTASITHNHEEGIKGAQATAAAIFMARNCATKAEIKQYIEQRYGYNLSRTCDEIRPTYQFNESCQETVPQAITSFLDSQDMQTAIRLAVSLGGDSDTLACITGGIAEAFYGIDFSIPKRHDINFNPIYFDQEINRRLPDELKSVVTSFYDRFVIPKKLFWAKNESTCELVPDPWISEEQHFALSESDFLLFRKGYAPDFDMRYGLYFDDGWFYAYRSHYVIKKFRFERKADGLYHIVETYSTNHAADDDIISEILYCGYFAKKLEVIQLPC